MIQVLLQSLWALLLLVCLGSAPLAAKEEGSRQQPSSVRKSSKHASRQSSKPNFVIVLADDLDWTLGGTKASTLSKTRRLIGSNFGKTFENWFVQTPVCCASRSEMLTGRVFHNLRAPKGQHGCQNIGVEDDPEHPHWRDYYFSNYFASKSSSSRSNSKTARNGTKAGLDLNYKVGIFGKHLNPGHNPTHFLPNGVDEWLINGGGDYLDPTFLHGKRRKRNSKNATDTVSNADSDDYFPDDDEIIETVKFDNCTESTGMPCYSTSVIGNASLAWIRRQVEASRAASDNDGNDANTRSNAANPFLALISVKAPHIQDGDGFPMAIPAPWYKDISLVEQRAPRTPNYNTSTTTEGHQGHHWLVRSQPPLSELEAQKVDELYVSRLKTLLSVDDLVEDLVKELTDLKVLENTYILFTSDNGYRLGQFQMPQCKLHPYENDVRVPMMIRGPGITSNKARRDTTDNKALVSHVHLMPTLLGLATGAHDSQAILPETMDGTNLAWWLLNDNDDNTKIDNINDGNGEKGANFRAGKHSIRNETSLSASSSSDPSSSSFVSLLIEYTSVGNVVRYQHLIDTFNHSFVALRIMPMDFDSNTSTKHQAYTTKSNTTTAAAEPATGTSFDTHIPMIEHISNLKYIEFRDSRVDWTNTEGPPLERELYDLDKDPFELDNLLSPTIRISPSLLLQLEMKMDRLIACSGESCRREHATGLFSGSLLSGE